MVPTDAQILALFPSQSMTDKQHSTRLKTLAKKLDMSLAAIMIGPGAAYKQLMVMYPNRTTRASYISSVMAAHARLAKPLDASSQAKWQALRRSLDAVAHIAANQPTTKSLDNAVALEEVVEKAAQLRASPDAHASLVASVRLLLLDLVAYQRPKRSDLGQLAIHRGADPLDKTSNYVVILPSGPAYMSFNKFKTAKKVGTVEEDLHPQVLEDLLASLRRFPRTHVLVTKDGRPFKTNETYSKFFIRTFADLFDGRKAGSTLMRHMYISSLDLNDMTQAEKQREARLMHHSVAQQALYSWAPAGRNAMCKAVCSKPRNQ